MTAAAAGVRERTGWGAAEFSVDSHLTEDGALILTPRVPLRPYPRRLGDALEHWASQAPDRMLVARRGPDGAWYSVSYAVMLARVRALGAGLARLGLSAERPLVILSGNSIEHWLLALAAQYVGIPYCPVSPAYSHSRGNLEKLRYVAALLTPGLVAAFDTPRFERALEVVAPEDALLLGDTPLATGRSVLTLEDLSGVRASVAQLNAVPAQDAVTPDSIAKFLLTSGSTGKPKAVVTTHRMLCSNQAMLQAALPFLLEEPPIVVDWLPWNHTYGGSHNLGAVLFNGGSLYIDDGKPTAQGFADSVRNLTEIAPTVHFNVPKGFEMLTQCMDRDTGLRDNFFRRLRACFFAGAGLSQYTWDALDRHAIAVRGERVPVLSGLGATETAPSVTFTSPATERSGVVGLPAPGCVIKLAPVGGKLELRARGPNVTPGYWRAPDQTAAAFDEAGFFRLGDAVRLADPANPAQGLIFDGRIAEDFKLSTGTWVSVGPLRAALLQALAPLALDVVIAGLDRDFLGLLILVDAPACQSAIGAPSSMPLGTLARHPALLELLGARLHSHAQLQSGSSTRIERAAVLPEAPSLDRGEITDKGSINQRLVLERQRELVDELYRKIPPAYVIQVGPAQDR